MIPLGPSDILISPVGLGAWAWGDRLIWNYGHGYGTTDVEQAFQESVAAGVNFIDTAEIYGMGTSERLVGRFLKQTKQALVITTKFFPSFPWRLTRGSLIRALKGSLKRLQIPRADLYLIHQPYSIVPVKTWVNGLADAVEQGLTRLVGVSNYNLQRMRLAHETLARRNIPLASNQIEYSLIQRQPEFNGLLAACHDLKVTPVAYSPIGMGLLTGKYTVQNPPPGPRGMQYRSLLPRLEPLVGLMREIGQEHRIDGEARTPAQVAINWTICKGTVPIPGAKNGHQARMNAGAMGWRLTGQEMEALDRASEPLNRTG